MLTNTHFAISVHVLTALAYDEGRVLPSDRLAETVGTNPSFLRGLIGSLRDAGLVETRLGKGGGSVIGRPAGEITLLDVYEAVGTSAPIATHGCDRSSPCRVARSMSRVFKTLNGRIESAIEAELDRVTIADVLAEFVQT